MLLEDTGGPDRARSSRFLGVLLSQLTGHDEWDGVGSVGGRPAARLRRLHRRLRDQEPADRRVGHRGDVGAGSSSALEGGPEDLPAHPPADLAHRARRRCWSPRRSAWQPTLTAAEPGGGHRRRASSGSAPRCRSRRRSTWSRTSTARVRKTRRTPPLTWSDAADRPAAPPDPQAAGLAPLTQTCLVSPAWSALGRSAPAEGAEGALLLEVERAARAGTRRDMAGAAAEVGHGSAGGRVGEHAQAERQRGRA